MTGARSDDGDGDGDGELRRFYSILFYSIRFDCDATDAQLRQLRRPDSRHAATGDQR